jgi:K+-transporting ATPase A subunit
LSRTENPRVGSSIPSPGGTLPIDTTFGLLLLGTILLTAAVNFLPGLAMGPIVELLQR